MESRTEQIVYGVIIFGLICIIYGLVGLVRKKITIHYRNHAWEGKGAVLVAMIFIITGFGLVLSMFL